ncbi:reverse transcriptase domain-containing protein [Tanacetum coccineum]
MLKNFPLTLTGAAKRWLGRTPYVSLNENETLYQTWERFNELLFKCLFHDLNDYQKVNTFYKGLSAHTRQILDSRGIIIGLTVTKAMESIQEKVDHSHRWHEEESNKNTSNNPFSTITEKLKILNHDMNSLREDFQKIYQNPRIKFHREEVKANQKDNAPVINSIEVPQECTIKLEPPQETPKLETFSEKVKKRIRETRYNEEKLLKKLECEPANTTTVNDNDIRKTPNYTWHLQEFVSNKIQFEKSSMVKLNAQCSAVLENELPPKEKDPGCFVLPCSIGNTTVSNALANLGASISVMPFSMFKRLGFRNPRPVNMVIEMADRSMQSLKGIVENVLVKIHKFIIPVDFVILDIIEDNKVPIILGRPMLATTHARIDVFGGKILLEVGKE